MGHLLPAGGHGAYLLYPCGIQQKTAVAFAATVDVDFMFNGNHYKGKMYIPLPSERGFTGKNGNEFGFEKKGEWQTKENIGLKYLPDGQQNIQDIWGLKLKCFYDAATDEFTIQICNSNWDFITAYLCKSNGDSWRSWK